MLQELVIKDFAIIDQISIDFQDKMTVLTGETGAGKSIIIDALGLLAGGRGSTEYIRKGENKSSLQGQFIISKDNSRLNSALDDLGIELEDDTVILQRDIYQSGRNVCRVNGNLVNLAGLRKIGENLIDIHGQNEHQELMNPDSHIRLLDSFSSELKPLLSDYTDAYKKYRKLCEQLRKREENEKQWAQRLDILQFQVKEIEDADLKVDEEEKLNDEKEKLDNFQLIHDSLEASYQNLEGQETNAMSALGIVMNNLEKISNISKNYNSIYEKVSDAYYNLQDVSREVSDYLDSMEWDPNRLDQIEQRLELIYQLKRKYGDSVEQVLKFHDKIKSELDTMQANDSDVESQKQMVKQAYKLALDKANKLSKQRKIVAKNLEAKIHKQLSELCMDKAIFNVKFIPCADLTVNGKDRVEFYIQTNLGESMGPLAKIASGGELSRIMLALKTIFSKDRGITSIIFDEVDTGVSGRVAQAMAEKISQISQNSQVLCITHLPQVAAIADHHFFIEKRIIDGRTETTLTKLDEHTRVNEIARMISGTKITDLTTEHAQELIKQANDVKSTYGQSKSFL